MGKRWPNDETEVRVRAVLNGPNANVVRTIASFPKYNAPLDPIPVTR